MTHGDKYKVILPDLHINDIPARLVSITVDRCASVEDAMNVASEAIPALKGQLHADLVYKV